MYFIRHIQDTVSSNLLTYLESPVGSGAEEQKQAAESVKKWPEDAKKLGEDSSQLAQTFAKKWDTFNKQAAVIDGATAWKKQVEKAWDKPAEKWEKKTDEKVWEKQTESEQEKEWEVSVEAFSSMAKDIWMKPEVLKKFYQYSHAEGTDASPKTLEEAKQFANKIDKFQKLLEKSGRKLPETEADFKALMAELTDENGNIHIPLNQAEAESMGFVFKSDGTIDFEQSPAYASTWDAPAGRPYVRNGQVQSGYRWWVNRMNIDIENLSPGVEWLVEMVYQAEAGGDPDIIYSGCPVQPPQAITKMTVGEVRKFQDRMVASGSASSAVGACQVIRKTMDGAIASGILSPNELFDKAAQKKFTVAKMEERGLSKFKSGNISDMKMMKNLSMEWASFPKDMTWKSYYAGDGLNHAGVKPEQVLKQLASIKGNSTWMAMS